MKGDYQEGRTQQGLYSSSSEEEEEGGGERITKRSKNTASSANEASIDLARRSRGRPLGSKNKPKPPMVIARETIDPSMHPHILHLPAGVDVIDAVTNFSRRLNSGLCILNGTGAVANVTLRHPTTTTPSTVTFHGRFEILSLSATFLPPCSSSSFPSNGFKILIAGAQGRIVGGSVVGSLMAAGTVVVVATVFSNPSFHRLSGEDEISVSGSDTNTHRLHDHHQQQQQQQQQPFDDQESHGLGCSSRSGGMSVYSFNLPSNAIWAPLARPPPPY